MTNERVAVSAAELEDLDLPRLDAFVAERAPALFASSSRDEVAMRLGLLTRAAPRMVPTVTGLYVFGKLPQIYFPEWGIVCMASTGTTLLDPVAAREDLEGGLVAMLDGCMRFLRTHCGGTTSPEAGQYEISVVREAVLNAIIHRDLRRPSRIALRLFLDRLEIWSPGGPVETSTDLEEMGRDGGVSLPRNPILASVARGLGFGEQLGRGLHLICHRGGLSMDHRAEVRSSPREVVVVLPSRWQRPRESLSS